MSGAGSYDAERETDLDSEIARLHAQVLASWPVEARRLRELGLEDGMRVLEIGCGPGLVTERLRELLPSSPITAIDADPAMIDRARTRLEEGERTSLLVASAEATGLEEGQFDFVLSRYVFQHLSSPERAAREALRLLRPGGRHAIIDVDDSMWGIVEPEMAPLRAIYAKVTASQSARGGDRTIGRKLGKILREAGYSRVLLDSFSADSDDVGLALFLPQISPDRLAPLVLEGALSLEDLAISFALFEEFSKTPGARVLMIGFIACGERPR